MPKVWQEYRLLDLIRKDSDMVGQIDDNKTIIMQTGSVNGGFTANTTLLSSN